jgi:mono/diheme cytochrome c family protein
MSEHAPDVDPAPETRRSRRTRNAVLGLGLLAAGAAAAFTWQQVKPVLDAQKYANVERTVPVAPKLTAQAGETIYRIDPTASSLTYEVQETFAGQDTSTATGTTDAIAGDLAINAEDLGASRVGLIKADVEQFTSDNNLRDARLRAEFLRSNAYPIAAFEVDEIDGLDGPLTEGEPATFTMTGSATVKGEQVPVTWDATAELDDEGALVATATTVVKLSDIGAGPISIAGLVRSEDDVTLTLELTAWNPDEHDIPTTLEDTQTVAADGDGDGPSFEQAVKPIVEANCVSCHATGEMAGDKLAFDDAGDVAAVSDGIETVTALRYMPPWPASDEGVELKHSMELTDEEIELLGAWSDAGGQLDVPADTELVETEQAQGPAPRQDLVLDREPYTGDPSNMDDYRCFVLDPEFTEPTFLTGYTFIEDQREQLHHVQVFHISEEQKRNAADRDGADGKPGWSCYAGPMLEGRPPDKVPGRAPMRDAGFSGQSHLVAGWVPGQAPSRFPQESGILMAPGDALVMQVHYHFAGKATEDRSTLAIEVEDGDADIDALRVINPIGPVEIPCAPEDQDEPLCDRDAALEDNVRLYGPSGAANEQGLLLLCGWRHEDLAATFDGSTASSSCDHKVPEDGTLVAVLGHMHTIGETFRFTLDPGTDQEQILLDIPDWQFGWQLNYELAEPIEVKRGQPLKLECSWDRRRDPDRIPKYMVFAEGTDDEMCFATYAIIPKDQG